MKRSRWIFLGILVALAAAPLVAFLGPRPAESLPLAELVPPEAIFYAGFRDYRKFEALLCRIPGVWNDEDRRKFEEAKPHLEGAIAFYVDPKGEWVGLARLTRGAALANADGDAAVFAQTPAALARWRARAGSIRDVAAFRQLRSPFFLNMEGWPTDFSAVGFEISEGSPWTLRGRALYRPANYRSYIENYVQTPRKAGGKEKGAPIQVALTDPFLRLWDKILEGLTPENRERVEHEMLILRREVLAGRDLRDFLSDLGPRWGVSVVETPQKLPALVAWLDLPDASARTTLQKLLERAAADWERLLLSQGQGPWVAVERNETCWRLAFPWEARLRLGDSFTPAYVFAGNRLVVSTCAAVLPGAEPAGGDAHAALDIQVAPSLELLHSTIPFLTDRTFSSEADAMAMTRLHSQYNPLRIGILTREKSAELRDPNWREKAQARFAAEGLAEIAKSSKYREELARHENEFAKLAERLGSFERISGTGRYRGDGFEFELRAWPRHP